MFKRVSLLWKRDDVSSAEFAEMWLGEHAEHAKRLRGLREYVIDLVEDPQDGAPDGIATLRFDSREACEAAFAEDEIVDVLLSTRDEFARRAQIFYVDENVVHRDGSAS